MTIKPFLAELLCASGAPWARIFGKPRRERKPMRPRKFGCVRPPARPPARPYRLSGRGSGFSRQPDRGEVNAIFSRTLGQHPFHLAGNYNAIVSPVDTFQREVFLKTFFSLFSEAIVLQNSRSFNSRKLFYRAIVMSTNNSEANITCRRHAGATGK